MYAVIFPHTAAGAVLSATVIMAVQLSELLSLLVTVSVSVLLPMSEQVKVLSLSS